MKSNKIYIVAAICLVVGFAIFIGGFAMVDFDYTKLGTDEPFEQKNYTAQFELNALNIEDDNADINISLSTDNEFHMTYFENEKHQYDILESIDGYLTITKKTSFKWTDHIMNLSFEIPKLNIEIPEYFVGDIEVKNKNGKIIIDTINARNLIAGTSNQNITLKKSTLSGKLECSAKNGDVTIEEMTASEDITAKTYNGKVTLSEISGRSIHAENKNGDILANAVSISGNITAKTYNGKVSLSEISGRSVHAENKNGNISLSSVLTSEDIYVKTTNENINLEKVSFATDLVCDSNNGNITGDIVGKLGDFSFDCKAMNGECNLPQIVLGGEKSIYMKTNNGKIDIEFTN